MKTMNVEYAESKFQSIWLKRMGIAGFLFFLAKGLLWLAVPALLAMFGMS